MTDTPADDADPTEPQPDPAAAAAADSDQQTGHDPRPGDDSNREAAGYRRRLRDTEAERDGLKGQLAAARRALVDGVAEQQHIRPAALWAAGTQLEELFDEAGNLDPAAVTAACDHAASQFNIHRGPRPDYSQGGSGTAAASVAADPWTDAFRLDD